MSQNSSSSNINGILLLNKSEGLTSNVALQKVKRLFGAKKAGHTGSLDPLATGMLPICFGEATKFCQYLLDADKSYQVQGQLGIKTNTADATGEIIARKDNFTVSPEQLQKVIHHFIGTISQTPSMFSALKHKGQPLYKYARAGIEIERPPREIVIKSIQITSFKHHLFELNVACSKGTYIRNLVEDIGEALGVYAHVTALHRPYTHGFNNEKMYSLSELETFSADELSACLLSSQRAIQSFPRVIISEEAVLNLRQGKVIMCPDLIEGIVSLYQEDEKFIGLGESAVSGELKVKRLLAY